MRRQTTSKKNQVLDNMEMTDGTNMTIGSNVNVDGQVTQNNDSEIALYRYVITLNGTNSNNDSVSIKFNFLTNTAIVEEPTLEDLETILGSKYDYTPAYDEANSTDVFFENINSELNEFNILIAGTGEESITYTSHSLTLKERLL